MNVRKSAYGILIREEKVLVTYTKSGKRTIVNFPGGGLDPGEDLKEALHREFKEETGAQVRIGKLLHTSDGTFINPDFPNEKLLCHYFLVEVTEPIKLSGNGDDVTKLEWIKIEDLPLEKMLDTDREFSRLLSELYKG